jgi:HAD superfamily hydrolase (TIGR01509 family)
MDARPILFCDFDGTICHQLYWRSLPHEKYQKVQDLLFRGDRSRAIAWMKGEYTAEQINHFVANEIGLTFEELWPVFIEDCKTMQVSLATLERLATLRQKYRTILTTVNTDSFEKYTAPALRLREYFDHISNSYLEKKLKSDNGGELYTQYAERFGVPIESCVVIDDSKAVCKNFEKLGGKACLVSEDKTADYYLAQLS